MSTLFLVGQWAEKNPREAKLIAEAGHEIGNHSYVHPDMTKLTASRIEADITKADAVIQQAAGVFLKYFRAPSDSYNDSVIKLAKKLNHIPIQWNVETLHTKGNNQMGAGLIKILLLLISMEENGIKRTL